MALSEPIFIDFETFFGDDYTLSKLNVAQYLLDPRFASHGCAVHENGEFSYHEHEPFTRVVAAWRARQAAGEKIIMAAHNAPFDFSILAWHYGFIPDLMIDTMGMARATIFAQSGRASLDATARALGVGLDKGKTLLKTKNMTVAQIKAAGLWQEYVDYAITDVAILRLCFLVMDKTFPTSEYLTMDAVIRCAVEPVFRLNQNAMTNHLHRIRENKQTLLERTGLPDREALMSNEKFAAALRSLGVEPPMKTSLITGKQTYALAKNDADFAALQEHEDPEVQALVAARLGFKSTIEETRTQAFIDIARGSAPFYPHGAIPMPLRYSGAHTHRMSGDWNMNVQNLGRTSPIRTALEAPPGYKVVAVDASQIEARITAWLAGQWDLVEAFANGDDIYSMFAASEIYGRPVNKKEHPKERFVGKQVILGCGFGVGPPKFQWMIETLSRLQLGEKLVLDITEAAQIVAAYRRRYHRIPEAWNALGNAINVLAAGGERQFGPVTFRKGRIDGPELPCGGFLSLYYPNTEQVSTEFGMEWQCTYGGKRKRLFGGKIMENIVQFLARLVVFEARRKLALVEPSFRMRLTVHDELVYVVPEQHARAWMECVIKAMSTPPPWGARMPLAAEGDFADSYGACK